METSISINAAAERLGVSPKTIRRLISSGRLPASRIGERLIRLSVADVDAVLTRIPTTGDEA